MDFIPNINFLHLVDHGEITVKAVFIPDKGVIMTATSGIENIKLYEHAGLVIPLVTLSIKDYPLDLFYGLPSALTPKGRILLKQLRLKKETKNKSWFSSLFKK